ncbi:MAG: type IV secretion system DNA-binding domain-containing protein [Pyrinomonadaceae bacterium]
MPSANTNKIVGMIGSKGTGKSTMAETIFKRRKRAVVFDTMGEYDYGFCVSERLAFVRYLRANENFRVCYLPLESADFGFVCKAVYLKASESVRPKENLLYIVEEVTQYCSALSTDEDFSRCIQLGRHANLDILYTGHRFADIARRVTSQTDIFYCFRVSEPRDVEALAARFGDEIAVRISSLENLQYLRLEVGKDNRNVKPNVVCFGDRRATGRVLYRGAIAGIGRESHPGESPR